MSAATIERLAKLGFTGAAGKIKRMAEQKRKLAIAYEHYRFVRQEHIDRFNDKLRKETYNKKDGSYNTLAFDSPEHYEECPPEDVLVLMDEAIQRNCFDAFEVAHVRKVEDPILFGRVYDCPDRFFIAQWDKDVTIEDLIMKNEG